jgi:hypothetical protein
MSLKAILATLVLGSSSVALARPVNVQVRGSFGVRDHRDYDGWWFRMHRHRESRPVRWYPTTYATPTYSYPTPEPVYQAPQPVYQQPQPIQLMAASELANRFDINVGAGQLVGASTVRLDASGCEGAVYIDKVTIYYGDRADYEQVSVGQYLDAQNATFDVGLRATAAGTRIIVDGRSMNGGKLAIEAL